MKKKRHILPKIILSIIILIVLIVVITIVYLDNIVKAAVDSAGTQALGTPTSIKAAHLSLLKGTVKIDDLIIANPPGYKTPNLITLHLAETRLDTKSIFSDTIKIDLVKLDAPVITIEQKGLSSNLQQILDNIKKQQGAEKTPPENKKPTEKGKKPTPSSKNPKKLLVKLIEIDNAEARFKLLPLPGRADIIKIKLAPILIKNISNDSNKAELGVTIFRKVLLAISQAAIQSGAKIPGDLLKGLQGSVKGLTNVLGGAVSGIMIGGKNVLNLGGDILKTGIKGGQETLKQGQKILKNTGKDLQKATKDLGKATKDLGDTTKDLGKAAGKAVNDLLKLPGDLPGFGKKKDKTKKK